MDAMIRAYLRRHVPQEELSRYLETAFDQHGATLAIAVQIVDALAPFLEQRRAVRDSDVARLSVHAGTDEMIAAVCHSLGGDFLTRLHALTHLLCFNVSFADLLNGSALMRRPGGPTDKDTLILFLRIFICAAAMASGIEIDPRASAAA